jgi:adenine-specific DNA-methyltransferase
MYRYIGNKTAILNQLLEVITSGASAGETFSDPMCGTASVSSALAQSGFKVQASDVLTFPVVHAKVRLTMERSPKFSNLGLTYSEVLVHLNSLKPKVGFFWNEYSTEGTPANGASPRQYFSAENAAKIDAIRDELKHWNSDGILGTSAMTLLKHDLILATNRIANIAGTYGHYRSSVSKNATNPIKLINTSFNSWASRQNSINQGSVESVAKGIDVDYLYLDPPYMKRQYAANYHLLETLAVGDEPDLIGQSGMRNWWPQYSDFCSKRKLHGAFDQVLSSASYKKAFISYSEDGLVAIDELKELLGRFGLVTTHEILHKRFKSNQSELSSAIREYVIEVDRR